jgi:hypothetical protein
VRLRYVGTTPEIGAIAFNRLFYNFFVAERRVFKMMRYFMNISWSLVIPVLVGCSVDGQIRVSHPRIWRQETIAQDSSARINELRRDRQELETALKLVAGSRLRREITETQVSLSAKSQTPVDKTKPLAADVAKIDATKDLPDLTKTTKDYDVLLGTSAGEEALDILRRKEDFGDLFTGTLLKYIRDDLSLRPERELYLLEFDISINPDGFTSSSGLFSSGYSARVRVDITPQNSNYAARVYAIAPQQYAERFREGLARRDDLSLALDLEKQGPGQGAKFALDRAMRSQEELALIQRYPLISSVVDSETKFGWQINPRFRVVDRPAYISWLIGRYGVENSMEDGIRTGLVAIEITRKTIEKAIADEKQKRISESERDRRIEEERSQDIELKLTLNTYWESNNLHHRIGDSTNKEFRVLLPGNQHKTFIDREKETDKGKAIHPSSGPGNRENVITIRGQNFGTRADVYVGSIKACSVRILSRDLIEATLPKCAGGDKDTICTKPQDIKVISHGDSYLKPGQVTFTYEQPLAKVADDGSTVRCASVNTGSNDQTSGQPIK